MPSSSPEPPSRNRSRSPRNSPSPPPKRDASPSPSPRRQQGSPMYERRPQRQSPDASPRARSPVDERRSRSPIDDDRRRSRSPMDDRRRSRSPMDDRRRSRSPMDDRRRSRSPVEDRGRRPDGDRRRSPGNEDRRRMNFDERRRSPPPFDRRRSPRGRWNNPNFGGPRGRDRFDPRRGPPQPSRGWERDREKGKGDRYNPEPCRVVGVFGLSYNTTERDLNYEFARFGKIDDCQLVLTPDGRSRGFGFITYNRVEDAREARHAMCDRVLQGKRIRVDYSISKGPHDKTPGQYHGRSDQFYPAHQRGRRSPSPRYDRRRHRSRSYSPRRY